jgi:hypothetical protein
MARRKTIVVLLALASCAGLVSACGSGGPGAALRKCPRDKPSRMESSTGTEGEAVPRGAVAALVCRWHRSRLSEATVRGWPADRLARTVDALPSSPELEGVYNCEAGGEQNNYLIGFAYPGGTGEQMEVSWVCGWDAINRRTKKRYEVTRALVDELGRDLREGR